MKSVIIFIIIISALCYRSMRVAQTTDSDELNLNILPAEKYKISRKDYEILKKDIEFQVMSRLMELQRNYDERENIRKIAVNQPMIPTMMVPNTNLRYDKVNIPISQRVEEERTYYKDKNEPLEGKYKKGYTFHLSEKEIFDLLELKKELEQRVNKEREEKEKENNERAIGKDLVLSPSLTEEGENIVINTKTNEIGKITKLHNDEVNQLYNNEEEEKKEIDNKDIMKLAENITTPILPKYKKIKESKEQLIIDIYKKSKDSYKDITLSEVREELKNKTLAELELLVKMI